MGVPLRLLTAIVTHNRLEYTKQTIESYLATVGHSFRLIVVDNHSTDATRAWLKKEIKPRLHCDVVFNSVNLFPGAACNIGWHHGLKKFDAELLHRSDNDIEYLPGWRDKIGKLFASNPNLGQLGVLNCHEDYPDGFPFEQIEGIFRTNPGGNCVIPRELWDAGVRWEAGAWAPGGRDEDTLMSDLIRGSGFQVGRVADTVCNNISFHRYADYPAYYDASAALRGLVAETSV